MRLEQLAVRLRPRRTWEAADLGFAMAREWAGPIYRAWLPFAGLVALLAVVLFGGWGLVLVWCSAPLLEAPVLFTLSRALFGEKPTGRATAAALPEWCRRGLPEVFLRRWHPLRIARLPVAMLEGLRGAERRQRVAALETRDQPAWLPFVFLLLEIGLVIALAVLIRIMTPSWTGVDWTALNDRFWAGDLSATVARATMLVALVPWLLLHPLYVAAGFAIYLNRRTWLEGWDVEVSLRRLARRLEPPSESAPPRAGGAALILACCLASVVGAGSTPLSAQEPDPVSTAEVVPAAWSGAPEDDPRVVIEEVMRRPELDRTETVRRWQIRQAILDALEAREDQQTTAPWLVAFAELVAFVGRPLMWIVAVILVLFLARAIWRRAIGSAAEGPVETAPPAELFGLDLRPSSLPEDIPGAAARQWHDGDPAGALSLLYRGALARLTGRGLVLRDSFTEDDCLRAARAAKDVVAPPQAAFFAELTRSWQAVAYAHRVPALERAKPLWERWHQHFETTA